MSVAVKPAVDEAWAEAQSAAIDGSGKSAAVRSGKSAAPKKERDKP
jgi:hypothetical protein